MNSAEDEKKKKSKPEANRTAQRGDTRTPPTPRSPLRAHSWINPGETTSRGATG